MGLDKLDIQVTSKPEGATRLTKKGDTVLVHYTGTLVSDGTKFDSSYDRKKPLEFQVGAGRVIAGWDQGLLDMAVGEKRTLLIPSSMAYGPRGFPPVIPANADLKFVTELMEI
ncbi:peptidyl-prolyl cis-trans isomerase, partial [Clavulina sp. PMI_390]